MVINEGSSTHRKIKKRILTGLEVGASAEEIDISLSNP